MKKTDEVDYVVRENKYSRYDKRLIMKIVKEVESGLPRKEATRIYGLGKATLDAWMRNYGSEIYHEAIKRRSYTKLEKRTIVSAIEQGRMTVNEAKIAYQIKNVKLINEWVRQYKVEKVDIFSDNESIMDKSILISKKAEKESLQKVELQIKALNTLIDVAGEHLKIDIRKKFGAKQS
ncbi:hypothetical protein [Empedobacter sp. ULE_I140]